MAITKNILSTERISTFILGGLFVFPILPFNIVSMLMIALLTIVIIEKTQGKIHNFNKTNFIVNIGFYVVFALSLIYADNLDKGLKEIQKGIPILLLSLVFFLKKPLEVRVVKIYLTIFIISNILVVVIIYNHFITNAILGCIPIMSELSFELKLKELIKIPFYELMWCSDKISRPEIFVHKVYNSMYFLFCNLSIIYLFKRFEYKKWIKVVLILCFILFSVMIVNMVSIVNLALLITLIPIYTLIISKKDKRKYLVLSYSILLMVGTFYFLVNKNPVDFVAKEIQDIGIFSRISSSNELSGGLRFDSRYYINSCAFDIIKENPIVGIGVGDTQTALNNCYLLKSSKSEVYKTIYNDNLNAHNQYLSYLISGGVVLLLLFILTLVYNVKKAYRSSNYLYLFFIIIIAVNFIFESMMSRMYGVMFFSLIINMFGAKDNIGDDKDSK